MNGDLDARLPVTSEADDIDRVARAVNLMLDEIWRLLDQLKSVGDNIAHDLRTPLAVARAKIERGLERERRRSSELRAAMADALDSARPRRGDHRRALAHFGGGERPRAKAASRTVDLAGGLRRRVRVLRAARPGEVDRP